MTLLRETPKDHGLLLDHDPKGKMTENLHHLGRQNTQEEWAPNPERRGRTVRPVLSTRIHGPVEDAGEATSTPGRRSQVSTTPSARRRQCRSGS